MTKEEEQNIITDACGILAVSTLSLRKENKALRECLEYYADDLNYQMTDAAKRAGDVPIIIDRGDFARAILDEFKKEQLDERAPYI